MTIKRFEKLNDVPRSAILSSYKTTFYHVNGMHFYADHFEFEINYCGVEKLRRILGVKVSDGS